MTHKVHKFFLLPHGDTLIQAPLSFQPVMLTFQRGQPTLWAIVNTETEKVQHVVRAIPTGFDLPPMEAWAYIGTLLYNNAELVLHYFHSWPEAHKDDGRQNDDGC